MEDCLYDVAYATCQDDEDLRDFAQRLEALGQDWPLDHARASYKAFRKLCTANEWKAYETKVIAALGNAWQGERLKIHMHRKECDQAVKILAAMRYPDTRYGANDLLKIAASLEKKYPDKILGFYRSGLGNLNQNAPRETYACWAKIAEKLRHMWLNVIKDPDEWDSFARKIKRANLRRPAFQQEFAKAVPGWREV